MLITMRETWAYPACATLCVAFSTALGIVWCQLRAQRMQTERERRGREELEAYARLDLRVSSHGDLKSVPRRVCAVIAARSPFNRVAMLMYTPGDHLYIAATEGIDAATVQVIEGWLEKKQPSREAIEYWDGAGEVRLGSRSSVLRLKPEDRPGGMAVLVPVRAGEKKIGALLVCAENILELPHRLAEEAVIGLEALAARLAHALEEIPLTLHPLAWASDLDSERYLDGDRFSMVISSPAGSREELGII